MRNGKKSKMNLVKYLGCDEFFQSRWTSRKQQLSP